MALVPSNAGSASSSLGSMQAAAQLFARLNQEIDEHNPKNCIHFIVDFLCRHYPEHLHGFASIWQMDPDLEAERQEVVNFFKAHNISTAVAGHFTNAGYDTLETLMTLSPECLVDIEAFNNVKWLPGHKVRLQQIFQEITARVRVYRTQQQKERSHGAATVPQGAVHPVAAMPGPVVTYRTVQQPVLALPPTATAPTLTGHGWKGPVGASLPFGSAPPALLGPTEWQFRSKLEGA